MEETNNQNSQTDGKEKISNGDKGEDVEEPIDLDYVLTNELGQFGYFQLRNILLVALPIMMSCFMSEYIFSAAIVPHRCRVPECDEDSKFHNIEPHWLLNAIPESTSGFSSCQRYVPLDIGDNGTLDNCPSRLFNQSITINCDAFVYAEDNTVVADFDLACQQWLRALAGFSHSLGTLLSLPITGYVSDHYGRRVALIINVLNLGLIGVLRAFSVNYTMYVILQILQSLLGGGTYSSAYIFAAEFVGPKYRVFTTATCPSFFAIGQILLAAIAWLVHPWRYMILTLHVPCFLIVSYYWILNESVRWLLSKQKFEEARVVLEKVAKVNKTHISEKSMQRLLKPPTISTKKDSSNLIQSVFQSPTLLRRVCTTPIWWITATFVYYGLSINSTNLAGNRYLNYIIISSIEIPGNYSSLLILNKIGRKATLSSAFFFSAVCNIAFVFIPKDMYEIRLLVYLLGKFGASIVMTSIYLYTSELYPTQYRHSLLGFSSMIGRIGSITAPLTPTLMTYWHGIPSLMFGCMGVLSGLLVLTQPETMNTKLPNTLAEADALGNEESKNNL